MLKPRPTYGGEAAVYGEGDHPAGEFILRDWLLARHLVTQALHQGLRQHVGVPLPLPEHEHRLLGDLRRGVVSVRQVQEDELIWLEGRFHGPHQGGQVDLTWGRFDIIQGPEDQRV